MPKGGLAVVEVPHLPLPRPQLRLLPLAAHPSHPLYPNHRGVRQARVRALGARERQGGVLRGYQARLGAGRGVRRAVVGRRLQLDGAQAEGGGQQGDAWVNGVYKGDE